MAYRKRDHTDQDKAQFAAQRQQAMQHLAERLSAAVAAIQDSETFQAYLRTQAQFHRYSFRNTLLILSQCPHATHVAGYETWRGLHRQVRKARAASAFTLRSSTGGAMRTAKMTLRLAPASARWPCSMFHRPTARSCLTSPSPILSPRMGPSSIRRCTSSPRRAV
jgi:hypothetical protein